MASEIIRLRDPLLTLLTRKVEAVRSAVRYVLRSHPDIQRLASSEYERRRRGLRRKASADTPAVPRDIAPAEGPLEVLRDFGASLLVEELLFIERLLNRSTTHRS